MSKNTAAVAETAVETAVEEIAKGSTAKTRVLVVGGVVVVAAAAAAGVVLYKRRKDAAASDDLTAVMDATNE